MKLILERFNKQFAEDKQTLSAMWVVNEENIPTYFCCALELPDKNNEVKTSKIPKGIYCVVKRYSKKYGNHFHIQNVPNRSLILIHFGNYYTQTEGCILVGSSFTDINNDNLMDVTSSKNTLNRLLLELPDTFEIEII